MQWIASFWGQRMIWRQDMVDAYVANGLAQTYGVVLEPLGDSPVPDGIFDPFAPSHEFEDCVNEWCGGPPLQLDA